MVVDAKFLRVSKEDWSDCADVQAEVESSLGAHVRGYIFSRCRSSRKHAYIILTPLNPTFVVKLGLTGLYIIFLISAQNIDWGYLLEPPHLGGSNEYNNVCFEQKYECDQNFSSENFQFLVVKFSIYLNRHNFEKWNMRSHVNIVKYSDIRELQVDYGARYKVIYIGRRGWRFLSGPMKAARPKRS